MDVMGVEEGGEDGGERRVRGRLEGVLGAIPGSRTPTTRRVRGANKKKPVVDSWEDEELSSPSASESKSESESGLEKRCVGETPTVVTAELTESAPSWTRNQDGQSLVRVLEAFRMVKDEFDSLFYKMWS
jgi:hypothetical protein